MDTQPIYTIQSPFELVIWSDERPRPAQAGEVARVVQDAVVQPAPGAVPDAPERVAANVPAEVDEVFLEYVLVVFVGSSMSS